MMRFSCKFLKAWLWKYLMKVQIKNKNNLPEQNQPEQFTWDRFWDELKKMSLKWATLRKNWQFEQKIMRTKYV